MSQRVSSLASYPGPVRKRKPLNFCVFAYGLLALAALHSSVKASNVHGRVQQLEVELRKKLQSQLKDKVQVAFNSSSFHVSSADDKDEEGEGVTLRTGLIIAPKHEWHLLEDSEAVAAKVKIRKKSPVCVLTPLPRKSKLEEAQAANEDISAHHVVASRLLHAARLVRMARDFAVRKIKLPGNDHRRRPRDPDLRPAYVHVVAPDYLADTVCKVVEDEFWEYTLRATCERFSEAAKSRRKKRCSFAIWGSSVKQEVRGRFAAASIFKFEAGIAVDLDKGDAEPPPVFPPSWIPRMYENFTDSADGSVQESPADGKDCPYTIVTAFSKNHYTVGLRLMNSILIHGPKSTTPFSVVIYTMETFTDVSKEQVLCVAEQIRQAGIPIIVRAFNFGRYPQWMYVRHYKAGWWAWKAVMVWETFVQRKGLVLWLDSGDYISGPEAIPATFAALQERSFVGITREWFGMNYRWTHPGTITFLGVDVSSTTTQCCGCLFGVTPKVYESMTRTMFECSMTLQCIAPEGSSMGNHRQDQSVLSVLAWFHGYECAGPHEELLWKCDGGRNHCSEPAKGGASDLCNLK